MRSCRLKYYMGKKGGLFRYADGTDRLLMTFGILGSIGDGLMTPLTMLVLSRLINDFGVANTSFSNDVVDKVRKESNSTIPMFLFRLSFFSESEFLPINRL